MPRPTVGPYKGYPFCTPLRENARWAPVSCSVTSARMRSLKIQGFGRALCSSCFCYGKCRNGRWRGREHSLPGERSAEDSGADYRRRVRSRRTVLIGADIGSVSPAHDWPPAPRRNAPRANAIRRYDAATDSWAFQRVSFLHTVAPDARWAPGSCSVTSARMRSVSPHN
jgi:hypothetical protein